RRAAGDGAPENARRCAALSQGSSRQPRPAAQFVNLPELGAFLRTGRGLFFRCDFIKHVLLPIRQLKFTTQTTKQPCPYAGDKAGKNGDSAPLLRESALWRGVDVCSKDRAKAEDFSPISLLFPETENVLCCYFHAARLKPMV
ncbi:MAG: hypothetical protein LBM64_04995, partial [Deltaproteobacteria bacterium]|nr:hypothetical protein [Deltaproteobacteria bacterium]